jgi:hypothetical protein
MDVRERNRRACERISFVAFRDCAVWERNSSSRVEMGSRQFRPDASGQTASEPARPDRDPIEEINRGRGRPGSQARNLPQLPP